MTQKTFQATSLRKVLIFLLVVILFAAIGGFYLGLQTIRTYAVDVSHTTKDAKASGSQVEQLQVLKRQLAQAKTSVQKADKLFATPSDYQTKAVKSLQRYASIAGVTINNTSFAQSESQTATQGSRQVTIKLDQPVSYERLIRFLQLVEGSIPKMQISRLTVSRPGSPNGDAVNVDSIGIRISVQ